MSDGSGREAHLAAKYDELVAKDYNRTKRGLGADDNSSRAAATSVAAHYNALGDRHRTLSEGSSILHLRNLNNWVKSVLIQKHLQRGNRGSGPSVLDLACGKGGDMLKFKAANCAMYVGVDIAANSVRDAVVRYNGANNRPGMPFRAKFMVGDFCDNPGAFDAALPAGIRFSLTSCQFALHYAFASEARAAALLANAASRLHVGGVFVATVPDANVLVRRLRAASGMRFGNDVYSVEFDGKWSGKRFSAAQPFGIAYCFTLREAVEDCEEYLVHLPTLQRLGAAAGLELLYATNFTSFFASEADAHLDLMGRMKVLPEDGSPLSDAEWEAAHSYMVVAFRRVRKDGEPALAEREEDAPLPTMRNLGHSKMDPAADIVVIGGAQPAQASASGGGIKRPRPVDDDDAGETRSKVKYDEDDLFG